MPPRRTLRDKNLLLAAGILAAGPLVAAAGPHPRPPEVAPAPTPLAAPEPQTGSPSIAAAPPPLDAVVQSTDAVPRPAAPVRTDRLRVTGLMDRDVVGSDKFDIGHVIDVLVDANGQPRAVLVETGGFLGIGNRQIAVAWTGISFPENNPDGPIRTNMTIAQVRSAPAYNHAGPVSVAVGAALPAPPASPIPAAAPPPLPPAGEPVRREAVPVAEPPPPLPAQRSLVRTR